MLFSRLQLTLCNNYATIGHMKATSSRKPKQGGKEQPEWPKPVQPGRAIVRVYRRKTPSGYDNFMVETYTPDPERPGKERRGFKCYTDEADAVSAAETLAKRIDARDFVAANMSAAEAIEYADAVAALKPFGVTVRDATAVVAQALKIIGDLSNLNAAVKFYVERRKQVTKKSVARVAVELLKVKKARGASVRYYQDLRLRLQCFVRDCRKDASAVTTADVQDWLDNLKASKGKPLSPQSYKNYKTILYTLFEFAVARGYAHDNPVANVEKLKVRGSDVEVFTATEIARLLTAADATLPAFVPVLAVGAFAGLRSAELERLEWSDIDLTAKHIVLAASKSKTASRRIVPIADNLAQWLQPYGNKQGKVWTGTHDEFYDAQQTIAAATEVKADEEKNIKAARPVVWKQNGLRHSYASYRFAQTSDAGRVAGELGNSASVVHRHYRELTKPADAEKWFAVRPADVPANVVPMTAATA